MDYQNGKIYQILNYFDDSVYVGSTCQPLAKRMSYHRAAMNSTVKKGRMLYAKMLELGVDNFYIELIEECNCTSIEELKKLEGQYIRERATLNHCVAGRTHKEWKADNPDKVKAQEQRYHEKHKHERYQRAKAWKSTKVDCVCGKSYTLAHKAEHEKSNHHIVYLFKQ